MTSIQLLLMSNLTMFERFLILCEIRFNLLLDKESTSRPLSSYSSSVTLLSWFPSNYKTLSYCIHFISGLNPCNMLFLRSSSIKYLQRWRNELSRPSILLFYKLSLSTSLIQYVRSTYSMSCWFDILPTCRLSMYRELLTLLAVGSCILY